MKIAISGSHGLIGTCLADHFLSRNDQVVRIGRDIAASAGDLESCDVLIHLAGASISSGHWTKRTKRHILSSRVEGTATLVRVLSGLSCPPRIFMCASATGYYGASQSGRLTEDSPAGTGFLAEVCAQWERAASSLPLTGGGARLLLLRFAPILSLRGGMLKAMLPAFKLGVGGPLGSGTQRVSWIALEEIPRIIDFLISSPDIYGPVNCCAPDPVSNIEFSHLLAGALNKHCFMTLPAFLVRLLFGEMGEELLLKGADVLPARLQQAGYVFKEPQLAGALKRLLK